MTKSNFQLSFSNRSSPVHSRITVHTSKYKVYPEISDQHRDKSQYAETVEEHRTSERTDRLGMQCRRVNQHRYECPYLFRVPSPISSPRHVCPYRSDKYSEHQQEYGWIKDYTAAVFQTANLIVSFPAPVKNFGRDKTVFVVFFYSVLSIIILWFGVVLFNHFHINPTIFLPNCAFHDVKTVVLLLLSNSRL